MRFLAALLFAVATLSAFASTDTGALTGRVVVGEAPAPGVTVTVTSRVLMHERTTVTGARGTFWIVALPPGTYDVTFSLAGHTTMTRRAIVELARVARADAKLERNEDEESVTSTATTVSVVDTTSITSHSSDAQLDRLPIRRDPLDAGALSPASFFVEQGIGDAIVDGAPTRLSGLFGQEIFEEVTVIRGAIAADAPPTPWGVMPVARTRSAGDALIVSLRDTMSNTGWNGRRSPYGRAAGIRHFLEATAGGRVIPDRLGIFAAAWNGSEVNRPLEHSRGAMFKANVQIAAAHDAVLSYVDGTSGDIDGSVGMLHYTAVPNASSTGEVHLSRVTDGDTAQHRAVARGTYFLSHSTGDHLLTGGASLTDFDDLADREARALFLDDRWSIERWTVRAGARYEQGSVQGIDASRVRPRVAVMFDPNGDGRIGIRASYGEYSIEEQPSVSRRELSVGAVMALGSSGHVRADAIERRGDYELVRSIELEGGYRLFDRFEIGANAAFSPTTNGGLAPERIGRAWFGAELPVGSHEFGFTFLQRFEDGSSRSDAALRYGIPFSRVRLLVATDVVDAFHAGRTVRLWTRVRL